MEGKIGNRFNTDIAIMRKRPGPFWLVSILLLLLSSSSYLPWISMDMYAYKPSTALSEKGGLQMQKKNIHHPPPPLRNHDTAQTINHHRNRAPTLPVYKKDPENLSPPTIRFACYAALYSKTHIRANIHPHSHSIGVPSSAPPPTWPVRPSTTRLSFEAIGRPSHDRVSI